MDKKFEYKYAVVIGRFQPVHNAHIKLIEHAASIADQVIIVLGSNRSAPTIKNPWNFEERKEMIERCMVDVIPGSIKHQKFIFISVKDYYYNDIHWITEVQQKVKEITGNMTTLLGKIALVGNNKDRSSYYLDLFPQWWKVEVPYINNILAATDIRDEYFSLYGSVDCIEKDIHPEVVYFLKQWKNTEQFSNLQNEYTYYLAYKKSFENVPYPVTFITTDVVVVKSGHVLLVRRKVNPGKGLLALPGGFLNNDEWIIDCAFRELKEETRIKVDKKILKEHVMDQRVFDHPDRSLRGRTITHAYYVKLPDGGELPEVRGGDDAKHALWMPLGDLSLHENEMFEDHLHIIGHFVNKW